MCHSGYLLIVTVHTKFPSIHPSIQASIHPCNPGWPRTLDFLESGVSIACTTTHNLLISFNHGVIFHYVVLLHFVYPFTFDGHHFSLLSVGVINTVPEATWAYFILQFIEHHEKGIRVETPRRYLEARDERKGMEECCLLVCSWSLSQFAFLYNPG